MRLDDFDYNLPPESIAQEPPARRDDSRLLVLDRARGSVRHRWFRDLPTLLRPGDLVVVNDTRVIPARLRGRRAAPGTGAAVEVLLLERLPGEGTSSQVWRALVNGARRDGDPIRLAGGLEGRLVGREEEIFLIELRSGEAGASVDNLLAKSGVMPTPPYIRRDPGDPRETIDRERDQTIFAARPGAVAAPTAGLHFTEELIEELRSREILVETLTLHVGLGTFQPVRVARIEDHRMHPETFRVPPGLARAVDELRRRGGRLVAVGTSVTRALEWLAGPEAGRIRSGEGRCDLFIYPGYRFRVVDAMITNFHLPRTTLLMLVSAFAGREAVLAAYREAIGRGYRFYSYGDATLIA